MRLAARLLAYGSSWTRDAYGRAWSAGHACCTEVGVDPWHAARGRVGARAREQEASGAVPATAARRLTALSSAYTYAGQDGDFPVVPYDGSGSSPASVAAAVGSHSTSCWAARSSAVSSWSWSRTHVA